MNNEPDYENNLAFIPEVKTEEQKRVDRLDWWIQQYDEHVKRLIAKNQKLQEDFDLLSSMFLKAKPEFEGWYKKNFGSRNELVFEQGHTYYAKAYKPKMTWEELVKFAKDYKFVEYCKNTLVNDVVFGLVFSKDGEIRDEADNLLVDHRTYEQMKVIIENMFEKELADETKD